MSRLALHRIQEDIMTNRYVAFDRATGQARDLTNFSAINPRWCVLDRETNLPVDDATTGYEARKAAQLWNAGIYTQGESS